MCVRVVFDAQLKALWSCLTELWILGVFAHRDFDGDAAGAGARDDAAAVRVLELAHALTGLSVILGDTWRPVTSKATDLLRPVCEDDVKATVLPGEIVILVFLGEDEAEAWTVSHHGAMGAELAGTQTEYPQAACDLK